MTATPRANLHIKALAFSKPQERKRMASDNLTLDMHAKFPRLCQKQRRHLPPDVAAQSVLKKR